MGAATLHWRAMPPGRGRWEADDGAGARLFVISFWRSRGVFCLGGVGLPWKDDDPREFPTLRSAQNYAEQLERRARGRGAS